MQDYFERVNIFLNKNSELSCGQQKGKARKSVRILGQKDRRRGKCSV